MAEKLVALTNTPTAEIATGLIGVLNNPHWIYEPARRRVTADDRPTDIPEDCGLEWSWENVRQISVVDTRLITLARPLQAGYLAATRAERGRVTDQLVLNHLSGDRSWTTGDTISAYQVVVRCVESKP